MHRLISWWRAIIGRGALERQMADEIQAHLEMRVDDLVAQGVARAEAERRARIEFGGVEKYKEHIRESRGLRWADQLQSDLRYAVRTLRRTPVFAIVAILSIALGVGANTAIFHLLDVVRLRALPIPNPSALARVRVRGTNGGIGVNNGFNADLTYPLFEQIRDRQQAFSSVFAWGDGQLRMGDGIEARPVRALWVSGEFFHALGLEAARGRVLEPADDRRPCTAPGIVLSNHFWKQEFGGRTDVIGRRVSIFNTQLEVIGVTPAGFNGLEVGRVFDVALPLCLRADSLDARHVWWLDVMGRPAPGWTIERASAHLDALSRSIFEATIPTGYAKTDSLDRYRTLRLEVVPAANGVSALRQEYSRSLWVLLAMAGAVLLITCANLANLMVARASGRTKEFAVRLALGASRGRLVHQLLSESVLLASIGTVAGVAVARFFSHALVRVLGGALDPAGLDLRMDWRVFAFASTVGSIACVLFGLTAASRASHVRPGTAIDGEGRGVTAGRGRLSLQRSLVAAQVAVSIVLIVGALLLGQTLRNLMTLDPGFRTKGVLVMLADLSALKLPVGRREPFKRDFLEHLASLQGVENAATTTNVPLYGSSWTMRIRIVDMPGDRNGSSKVNWVSHRYFPTMDVPLIAGRAFEVRDDVEGARPVALVNETFAHRLFAGEGPIGHVIETAAEPGYPAASYEIVGVVRDTKYGSLRQQVQPIVFLPAATHPRPQDGAAIVIRTADSRPETMITAVRRHISGFDRRIAVQIGAYDAGIGETLLQERMMATLSAFFGQLAVAIAAIGLYGLVSYGVAARRRELGIRLALGARPAAVLTMVLGDSAALVGFGIAIGLGAAFAATRVLRAALFEVQPTDPRTFALAAAVLGAVGVAAAFVPARRAARLDPLETLKEI